MKRTLLRLAALLPAFLIVCTVYSQTHTAKVVNVAGFGTIGFYEFRPANYGNQLHPLIIFLHGAGEIGQATIGPELDKLLAAGIPMLINHGATMHFGSNSFVVLSPQTPNNFNAGGGGEYWRIPAIMKYAKDSLHIDTNRIYITGLSMGAAGVWEGISYDPALAAQFAAAAPIATLEPFPDTSLCNIAKFNIPVWAFHNDGDGGQTSPYVVRGMLATLNACTNPTITPTPLKTYYARNDHDAWDNAYDTSHHTYTLSTFPDFTGSTNQTTVNLYEWFLSHTRASVPQPQPPVANAGTDQTISTPVSQASLSGSGTPVAPATISSYAWTLVSGPPDTVIFTTPLAATTTVTGLTLPGAHVFRLTVTDNNGLTGSATMTVFVNDAHPVVHAGSNQTITLPTSSVTLSGTDSALGGHTIVSTSWTQVSGPSGSTITSPSSLTTTVTGLVQGTYTFQLTATDNQGLSASSQLTVTVNPAPAASGALGYLVVTHAPIGDCGDTSSAGRFAIYGDSLASGGKLYSDSAKTTAYDGGFDWYEFAATINGPILHDLTVYPDGSVHSLTNCPGVTSSPSGGVPVLGYIKTAPGPDGNCGDTSTLGKTAIYGDSVAEGVIVSPDPNRTNPLDGGYSWVGFSSTLNGPIIQTFAAYADGSIHSIRNCPAGQQVGRTAISGNATLLNDEMDKGLILYPNPAKDRVTIHIPGALSGQVVTRISTSTGKAVLSKTAFKDNTPLDLPVSLSGLPPGLYIVEVWIGEHSVLRSKMLKQ